MSYSARLRYLTGLTILTTATFRIVQAQALLFNNVPETVNEGTEDVLITWTGGDGITPVQVAVVQNNRVIDTIEDDDDNGPQSAEWDVELENNVGGYYSLRLVQGTQTVDSNPINIIDEQGRGATGPPPGITSATSTVLPSPSNSVPTTSANSAGSPSASSLSTTILSGSQIVTVAPTASATGNSTSAGDSDSSSSAGSSGLSPGAIAGVVIGALVMLFLLVLLIWFLKRRAQRSREAHHETSFAGADEKHGDGSYLKPRAFALGVSAGTEAATGSGKGESELHGEHKSIGVYEMYSPTSTANSSARARDVSGHAEDAPYEMPSPDGPASVASRAATGGGLAHAISNSSPRTGTRSSISELIWGSSESGGDNNATSHGRVSGGISGSGSEGASHGHGNGSGNGKRNGNDNAGVIHELG